ncbi:MAG: (2Fe-2S)-binding protein [Desulfovermiculus sp.]
MHIDFTLNEHPVSLDVPADRRVVQVLREDLGLTSVKECCGLGECGGCTILVDGQSRLSCLMLAAQLQGRRVLTVEGLSSSGKLPPLQEAFVRHGAVQCGYCTPGMVLAAYDLLQRNPHPKRQDIRAGLAGNICRCTGYQKIVDAVEAACTTDKDCGRGY